MMRRWRPPTLLGLVLLALLPVVCGLFFLARHAPRDWSLHWKAPQTLIASMSQNDYATTPTPTGWDILWTNPSGSMFLTRFRADGRRLGRDILLRGSPAQLALARAGTADVAVWRQDFNGGSRLSAAVVEPGRAPVYRVLATGPYPLEHPRAFAAGSDVDVLFSWQRKQYDVYLSRVSARGTVFPPIQLTHVAQYAFEPHAALDPAGDIRLVYMDQCCSAAAFYLVTARYTGTGKPLTRPQRLDTIGSVGSRGSGSTPEDWGVDVQRYGNQVWAAWAGDSGISTAIWQGARLATPAQVSIPGVATRQLSLALQGSDREVVWQNLGSLGQIISTIQLDAAGIPLAAPDRVAFEGSSDESPAAVTSSGGPVALWEASSGPASVGLEMSRFSPKEIGAPSIWARFGLGLANPVASFAILVFGGAALGLLLAIGNFLLIIALALLYLFVFRVIPPRWKPYAFAAALALILYAVFVSFGAPSPPILFLTSLSPGLGLVAVVGLGLFVAILARMFFRRIDEVYRAGLMAFAGMYFIAFLQALTIVQGSIAKI